MVEVLDKNTTKNEISFSANDKKQLGNMDINLDNEKTNADIWEFMFLEIINI